MTTLLNYANYAFRSSQRKNAQTGLSVAGFDRVLSYGPEDIEEGFYQANQRILDTSRGNGLWLWKPYFILRTLQEMEEGDYLFYCDSGSFFIHSIQPLIDVAVHTGQNVMTFEDQHAESKFTKRDVFIALDTDEPAVAKSPQRLGGFSLWKKCPEAIAFAQGWLRYAQDHQLISDAENASTLPNYPEFVDHRHDQSIFSVLAKKQGLPGFRDPSQWGNDRTGAYQNSPYPQIIELTRQRDIPWRTRIKRRLKKLSSRT